MSCCCLAFLGLWLSPRLILVLIWFLSDWTTHTFRTTLFPLLGFFFFPFATLFYLLSMHYHGYRRTTATTVWAIIGLLFDLSIAGGTHQRQTQAPNFWGRENFRASNPVVVSDRAMARVDGAYLPSSAP